jgi:[acyl-carrier-protein] S-malonyltransferase
MISAANRFIEVLKDVLIQPTNIKVLSNVSALPQEDAQAVRSNLVKQITASVQWVASMEYIMNQGITEFIEIGPGKVLKGLMRRINSSAIVHNIEKPADIDSLII